MNDIDKMPSKCRDCPYWERAAEPYVCCDCENPVEKRESDYILRSDALKELYRDASATDPMIMIAYRVDIHERLESIPAADVKPKTTGKWIYDSDHIPHCSECEKIALQRHKLYLEERVSAVPFVLSNFCPDCGARLELPDE